MYTTSVVIAAGDSASSGWFEGWIGGLIAAAVTISATVWWEARQHRRQRLDDAVDELNRAMTDVWQAILRMSKARWDHSELELLANVVTTRQIRVSALAGRRVLGLRASIVAPGRNGLRKSLDRLAEQWVAQIGKFPSEERMQALTNESRELAIDSAKPLIRACQAEIATCNLWSHDPSRFWPNRDRFDWAMSADAIDKPLV